MKHYLLGLTLILSLNTFSQPADYTNTISTAVPFLNISTNARIGAFGEIAAVSSPFYRDGGLYQNPALLSRNARYAGGNMSYAPWQENLTNGVYLGDVNGYYAINPSNAVGIRFCLFHMGEVTFVDQNGNPVQTGKVIEYYNQITYNHSFKNGISVGGGIKYIRSNPGVDEVAGVSVKPANAVAIDLGFDYGKGFQLANIFVLNLNTGIVINNFGSKIKYTSDADAEGNFLPTTLRVGILVNPEIQIAKDFTLGVDLAYQLDKLLVPTPPMYKTDDQGNLIPIPGTGKFEIEKGMDPDVSPFRALYQSFYDAPYGFNEELTEIIHKFGGELRLDYQRKAYIAGRIGKFIEDESKGGRNYMTWGVGIGAWGFTLDYKEMKSDTELLNNTWALTFGFRTTLTNPAFRF